MRKGSNVISSHFSDNISLLLAKIGSGGSVPNFEIKLPIEAARLPATTNFMLLVKIN